MIMPFMHNGDVKSFVKSKRKNILEVTKFPEVTTHFVIFVHSVGILIYIAMYTLVST